MIQYIIKLSFEMQNTKQTNKYYLEGKYNDVIQLNMNSTLILVIQFFHFQIDGYDGITL